MTASEGDEHRHPTRQDTLMQDDRRRRIQKVRVVDDQDEPSRVGVGVGEEALLHAGQVVDCRWVDWVWATGAGLGDHGHPAEGAEGNVGGGLGSGDALDLPSVPARLGRHFHRQPGLADTRRAGNDDPPPGPQLLQHLRLLGGAANEW
jgi:hypothetical protein